MNRDDAVDMDAVMAALDAIDALLADDDTDDTDTDPFPWDDAASWSPDSGWSDAHGEVAATLDWLDDPPPIPRRVSVRRRRFRR